MKTNLIISCILIVALSGCVNKTVTVTPRDTREPAWLEQALEEDQRKQRGREPEARLTERSNKPNPAGGQPRSLTDRLQQPTPAISPTNVPPTRSGSQATTSSDTANARIEINVSQEQMENRDAPTTTVTLPSRSSVEDQYTAGRNEADASKLEQFGYDFFRNFRAEDLQGPASPDYELGPGDEVQINVWGSMEAEHALTIDAEGNIAIPEVGVLPLNGVRFDNLESRVRAAFGDRFREFELRVALGRRRSFPVYVVGNVKQPGVHEVTGRATLLCALGAAGGPTEDGTLRRVQIQRPDGSRRVVDLYEFLMSADQRNDVVIRPGDSIHVPTIGGTIAVAGHVQRPAIYELLDRINLMEVIELAGGVHAFTSTAHVQLERSNQSGGRSAFDIAWGQLNRHLAKSGDIVRVFEIDKQARNVIEIAGQIQRPGTYAWYNGMKLSDLFELAGMTLVDADLSMVAVSRQFGHVSEYAVVKDQTTATTSREVIYVDVEELRAGNNSLDLTLLPLDHVMIPSINETQEKPTVSIIGGVRHPGTYELTSRMTVSDLVRHAGGLVDDAYLGDAEIARRTFDAARRSNDIDRIRFDMLQAIRKVPEHDIQLQNLDQITVRRVAAAQVTVNITGQVRFPGTYVLPAGAKISDLVVQAGGLNERGDLGAALFTREAVRQIQQARIADMVSKSEQDLMRAYQKLTRDGHPAESAAGSLAMKHGYDSLNRMRSLQATGRIVVHLDRHDFDRSQENLELENGDALDIPPRSHVVMVLGEVFNPMAVVHNGEFSVEDYLEQVGGMTPEADDDSIYVIRANGTVTSARQKRVGKRDIAKLTLNPGDSVLVPPDTMGRSPGRVAFDVVHYVQEWASVVLLLSKSASLAGLTSGHDLANRSTTKMDQLLNFTDQVLRQNPSSSMMQQVLLP
ncbi:MAG: SLBB domain-containing protein [Phycisphaerae bacterium]